LASIGLCCPGRFIGGPSFTRRIAYEANRPLNGGSPAVPVTALATLGEEPDIAFFESVRLRALVGECDVLLGRPRQATWHLQAAVWEVAPTRAKTHALILLLDGNAV